MIVIPDVNLLLAYGWKSHSEHSQTRAWLNGLPDFATCPITELGFLRVSISPAYRADFNSAMVVLRAIKNLKGARFMSDGVSAEALHRVTSYTDTTDAYLVALAESEGSRLATLDNRLVSARWAAGVAYHPFTP